MHSRVEPISEQLNQSVSSCVYQSVRYTRMTTRTRDVKFVVGNRVSVSRTHFDTGGSSKADFSQLIPSNVSKLFGTIHRVYKNTQKAYVRWDCDGRFAEAFISDITLEPDDLPIEVLDFVIEFRVEEVEDEERKNNEKVEGCIDPQVSEMIRKSRGLRERIAKRNYSEMIGEEEEEEEDDEDEGEEEEDEGGKAVLKMLKEKVRRKGKKKVRKTPKPKKINETTAIHNTIKNTIKWSGNQENWSMINAVEPNVRLYLITNFIF